MLAGLTRLKQVCNHPAHYLDDGSALEGRSGKLSRCEQLVARFSEPEGPPVFLLSIKAGGTGLNLTAASHVIHYDRWWNPAVEDQATDRAHRLGQRRTVHVHKLVCGGTVEEGIDALIRGKRELAERVVGSGEQALSQLSTEELRRLIQLRDPGGER